MGGFFSITQKSHLIGGSSSVYNEKPLNWHNYRMKNICNAVCTDFALSSTTNPD